MAQDKESNGLERVSCYTHSPHINIPISFKMVIYRILERSLRKCSIICVCMLQYRRALCVVWSVVSFIIFDLYVFYNRYASFLSIM